MTRPLLLDAGEVGLVVASPAARYLYTYQLFRQEVASPAARYLYTYQLFRQEVASPAARYLYTYQLFRQEVASPAARVRNDGWRDMMGEQLRRRRRRNCSPLCHIRSSLRTNPPAGGE